jgi:FMN phosphatase YigB (HAD superfamily)
MIIIFDLDRTIFDTEKFKKDIANTLNINIKQYNKDCKNFFTDKNKVYNPQELLRILKGEKRISSIKNYKEKIEGLLKNADKYLLPGAIDVLKKFRKGDNRMLLISIGHKPWQKKKIDSIKIKKYFDKIIIIEKEKYKNLEFLKKEKDKILIINDDAGETLDMKKAIGKCEVCLIHGPYSKNAKHNFNSYNIKDCLKMYE